jgi:NACalpha-BTF3-like transcription factor
MNFESIEQFLDLVVNPAKYQAAIAELKAQQKAIESAIAVTHDIATITEHKAAAQRDSAAAKEVLSRARVSAEKLNEKTVAELNRQAQVLQDKDTALVAREQAIIDREKAAAAFEASNKEKFDDLTKKEEHLTNWYARLADQQAEIDSRLEKLRSVMP